MLRQMMRHKFLEINIEYGLENMVYHKFKNSSLAQITIL